MNPNETSARPDASGLDRREFLRLSGTLAAAGALASAGCQPPQEATIPFHDMPESLVDGLGRARFFHTVIDGSPVLVRTREGRPILVAPSPNDASGRGLSVRHHAALMDLYDPDRARGPLSVRRGNGAPVASSWAAIGADVVSRLKAAGPKAVLLTGPVASPALAAAIAGALGADRPAARRLVAARVRRRGRRLEAGLRRREGREAPARQGRPHRRARRGVPRPARRRPRARLRRSALAGPAGGRPDEPVRPARGPPHAHRRERRPADPGPRLAPRRRRGRPRARARRRAEARPAGRRRGGRAAALAPFAIDAVAKQAGLDAAVLKALAGELAAAAGKAIVVAGGSAGASAFGPAIELAALLLNVDGRRIRRRALRRGRGLGALCRRRRRRSRRSPARCSRARSRCCSSPG